MKIALDFDDTYTRDEEFWNIFIDNALAKNYDIRIVTFRKRIMTDPRLDKLAEKIPVIYTEYHLKKDYTSKIVGWNVDIWIDDSPELIVPSPVMFDVNDPH